ncbi:hypothetical protein [Fusobacterium hwasookii]|uniref:hypothetical protein n=1 Tax=Fusobacterium hwasookii TaxID=1583098 RepID=UPI0028EBA0C7|nr:hypothetical protein [Fusobacterium hwasookii]
MRKYYVVIIGTIVLFTTIPCYPLNKWLLHNKWNHSDWASFLGSLITALVAIGCIWWQFDNQKKEKKKEEKENHERFLILFLDSLKNEFVNISIRLEAIKRYIKTPENMQKYVPDYSFNEIFFRNILINLPIDFLQTANLFIYDMIVANINIETFLKKSQPNNEKVVDIELIPVKELLESICNYDIENRDVDEVIIFYTKVRDKFFERTKKLNEEFEEFLKNNTKE